MWPRAAAQTPGTALLAALHRAAPPGPAAASRTECLRALPEPFLPYVYRVVSFVWLGVKGLQGLRMLTTWEPVLLL